VAEYIGFSKKISFATKLGFEIEYNLFDIIDRESFRKSGIRLGHDMGYSTELCVPRTDDTYFVTTYEMEKLKRDGFL